MSKFPKSIATLNEAMRALKITPAKLKELNVSNLQIVSPRSIRFDAPSGKPGTIRRVKLTAAEDGTILVQLHEVVEIEMIPQVQPDNVGACIKALTGVDFGSVA